jgi:hypothetical protein
VDASVFADGSGAGQQIVFPVSGKVMERKQGEVKVLVTDVKGSKYVDPRGNPYGIRSVREQVDTAIERVR